MEASRLLSLRPHPRLMQTIDSHTYFMGSELAANPEIIPTSELAAIRDWPQRSCW